MRWHQIFIAALALGFTIAVAAPPQMAAAQTSHQRSLHTKKKAVKHYRARRQSGGQIACTAFGCHPIPRNCHPTTGYRWDGLPSGFDAIVCR
ncbi:hypothetical protein ASD45_07265 [Pseudolabrys sp. Root1462]|jgi:hypothetical protein|uniref:hypothetical protein n=1 Tax=Pseudolabrys sp. Root1462 TaxID=1736466 RepID=UPI00070348F6|nr:hypothetical protein [Pseudolabrys sp. Root1462]KQZ00673.1 hypothetical protein ASD45_07265 [Pseudolabrys sp. Root1462]